ncbi:MAG: circadian clock protein KaiB [Coxiella sp. (in: Bacteria)]|nr:MAG: circadian clock protein KaiB [Coxiella sp. (in: g-proteobacteria)]
MKLELKLYITAGTPKSMLAISNLEKICSACARRLEMLGEEVEIDSTIIDILEYPEKASEVGVFATPTLYVVKENVAPLVLLGDLTNIDDILSLIER